MKQGLRFPRTVILTAGFLSFLAGLGLAKSGEQLPITVLLPVILIVFASWRRRGLLALAAVILLGTVAGLLRGADFLHQLEPYEQLYGRQVVVRLQADSDGTYTDGGQLEFDGSKVVLTQPFAAELPGRIRVQALGVPAIYRGDILEVSGKLFPAGGSRQGEISYAGVAVLGRSGSVIETIRREFVAGTQTALPEPQASFGLGLLVGQRTTLPDDLADQLAIVGLTHIIAVSGYNLTIIIRSVRRLTGKRSKHQSTVLSLLLVGCFLLFTGFSASIVRASIVSVLSIAAWYYGRTFRPLLLLALAAALTAGWNPLYIWSDIGWYLSFLAFFGVLILAPLLTRRLFGKKRPKFLTQIVIESLSAQVMAAPLILYIFSETSLIALLSNAVIVPLVPLAMLLSLIAGMAGVIVPVAAGWLAWPAAILMTYMLDLVTLLSRIPHARVSVALSLPGLILLYCSVLFITAILAAKMIGRYGKITDKETII